jgi:cellulose synthase/poly-beta-1,6-N-acetylglucosamine synthase-like glycosyltransferase
MTTVLPWALSLLLIPLAVALIDTFFVLRGRRRAEAPVSAVEDFEVVVPIWGSVRHLVNIDYLAPYGRRVVLCTTTGESAEFMADLQAIAGRHGFRVFAGEVDRRPGRGGAQRQTSGVIRDRLVRDVHAVLTARYVVCIDADTRTRQPLGVLVGRMAAAGHDLVSVRVIPANTETWLGKLQAHEYSAAMRLRLAMPWLVSGACHAGLRTAHRAVMERHSLFFQGNDVELGWLAEKLGLRVGHIPFEVLTVVPHSVGGWWRQRYAWAGGEIRLFLVNPQLVVRHPLLWLYLAGVTFVGLPWRWMGLAQPGWALLGTLACYWVMLSVIHRGRWDRWLLVYPAYAVVTSLALVPLGVVSYFSMAVRHRNAGLIRAGGHGRHRVDEVAQADGVLVAS